MTGRGWLWVVVLAGCADGTGAVVDATSPEIRDARVLRDRGSPDAEPVRDQGVGTDAAAPDATPPGDAGPPPDGGDRDAARAPDAGPPDAAPADAAGPPADAAPPDAGDLCADAIDLRQAVAERGFYEGDTRGAPARTLGSCGGAAGGEILFRYEVLPGEDVVVFATDHPETEAATVLYLRAACDDAADLLCARGNDASPGTRLAFEPPAPGSGT
ncbi:MAG: hypothetical protein R3F60_17295 [bacterium]